VLASGCFLSYLPGYPLKLVKKFASPLLETEIMPMGSHNIDKIKNINFDID